MIGAICRKPIEPKAASANTALVGWVVAGLLAGGLVWVSGLTKQGDLGGALTSLFTSLAGAVSGFLGKSGSSRRATQWFKEHGKLIETEVTEIKQETQGIKTFWQIATQWSDPSTGQVHVFRSDYLLSDPSPHLGPDGVPVVIDERDPKNYLMDLSFLPSEQKTQSAD